VNKAQALSRPTLAIAVLIVLPTPTSMSFVVGRFPAPAADPLEADVGDMTHSIKDGVNSMTACQPIVMMLAGT
jgi:hypothetical protein